ncbi:MAG: ribonuclease Y, partial [Clostridia bacterium]|nr:ribonuclease Y [Clostridia bacterium]
MLSSLTTLSALTSWAVAIISVIPALIAGAIGGYFFYRYLLKKKLSDAQSESVRILEDARLEAKTLRKDALLEAKEEQLRLRNEFEKESRDRRAEMQRQESRINQKEDSINKKEDILDRKIESLEKTKKELDNREASLENLEKELQNHNEKMMAELEKVSGMTKDEAKQVIITEMMDEARNDAAVLIKEIEKEAKEEGEKRAKNIVALAIQRCAVDQTSENTISVVELPNEDMKGRIIGRVGRNIKALESATGVDIIIDDTPDVVTLTGFDPVRREVARLTLQKLVADGRIHPGRIEEVADRVRRDMDATIKEAGESAVFDSGVFGIHPELVKLLGRMKFRTSYGQNVLKHSLEVSYLAGLLAGELGADIKTCRRAGLLHDIGKSVDHEYEGTHVQIGVELA